MAQKRKNLVFLITALLFAAQFIGNYGDYQIAAIPSSIYAAFHLTDMQFSSLITAPMLPCIFLSIVIGLMVDRFGILSSAVEMNPAQKEMADRTNPEDVSGKLADALKGADVFIGVSAPHIVSKEIDRKSVV